MKPADHTRQRLVRAALDLFTTQGYHPTTTPQIARKAGIAEGTIYRHFAGKQQLLNELYRGAARWATQLVHEAESISGGPRERLARLAELLVDGASREPGVVRLFLFQDLATLLDEKSRDAGREFRGALESVVAQGKSEGAVRAGGVDVLAAAWLGVLRVALERVLAREWGVVSSGVRLCSEAAWDAIRTTTEGRATDGKATEGQALD